MKIFTGNSWLSRDRNTGWRNISSEINPSVLEYYYRDPPRDDEYYQVEPGELEISCMIRREDFKVDLILDVEYVSSEFAAKYATFIPSGSSSPLTKIGLPVGTVVSREKLINISATPTQGSTSDSSEYIYVSGTGADTSPTRSGELKWFGNIYMNPGRFHLSWVTSDSFPTTLPGIEA